MPWSTKFCVLIRLALCSSVSVFPSTIVHKRLLCHLWIRADESIVQTCRSQASLVSATMLPYSTKITLRDTVDLLCNRKHIYNIAWADALWSARNTMVVDHKIATYSDRWQRILFYKKHGRARWDCHCQVRCWWTSAVLRFTVICMVYCIQCRPTWRENKIVFKGNWAAKR